MPGNARTPFREAREQVAKISTMNLWFSRFAGWTAQIVGHPYMFLFAVAVIIIWAITGPYFHYSNTWQLIINTGTTIITFLVVFLIQNTQNRDAKAMHLKLDELIRAIEGARDRLVDLEKLSDEELKQLEEQFTRLRNKASERASEIEEIEEEKEAHYT